MTIAELNYPRSMFTKEEVIKQKNEFEFPDMWEFTEDNNHFILKYNPKV